MFFVVTPAESMFEAGIFFLCISYLDTICGRMKTATIVSAIASGCFCTTSSFSVPNDHGDMHIKYVFISSFKGYTFVPLKRGVAIISRLYRREEDPRRK